MKPPVVRKWMRMGQVASRLGVANITVWRMIHRGQLLARYHSGEWRILRAHVECIATGLIKLEKRQ